MSGSDPGGSANKVLNYNMFAMKLLLAVQL